MHRVTIPGTTLVTSRLGFGTAALHHLPWPSDRLRLLQAAFDAGFTHFDTARMYGEGMAERSLGKWLAGGTRQDVTLASKFGIPANPWAERFPGLMYTQRLLRSTARKVGWRGQWTRLRQWSVASAEASLQASLRSLRTDWLDLLFVHEPSEDDLPALMALEGWLEKQKASGRVRYLGLAGRAAECLAIHQAMPGVFDVLQVEDSIGGSEADVLLAAGLPLQVTYGYLRLAATTSEVSVAPSPSALIRAALARNEAGMVLVSTRRTTRIRTLAAALEQAAASPTGAPGSAAS